MNNIKKAAAVIAAAALLMSTGCDKKVQDDINTFIQADGRDYGQTRTAGIGEPLKNSFFTMTVNEAYLMKTVSGFLPIDEGYEFLCVNVTVTNTSDKTINVGAYDFNARWGDTDDDVSYSIEEDGLGYDLYPTGEGKDIRPNITVTGNIYFDVPAGASGLKFEYLERWDDEFDGNTYIIDLGALEYMDDPDGLLPPDTYEFEIGDEISTAFFDMQVFDAHIEDTLMNESPAEGNAFVAVDVSVTNTWDETQEVGVDMFYLLYGEEGYTFPIDRADIADFKVSTNVLSGETESGYIYFEVPAESVDYMWLGYSEYFEGGSDFLVYLGTLSDQLLVDF